MKQKTIFIFIILFWNLSYTQERGLINNTKSPHSKLKSINISDCQWTSGFWAERFNLCHDVMLPNMWKLWEDPTISHQYDNFLIAAGMKEGAYWGFQWHDGDFYKWMEAAASVYAITKDEKINKQLDEIIDVIAKGQRTDGYLHTAKLIGHGRHGYSKTNSITDDNGLAGRPFKGKTKPFVRDSDHEHYNFGHLMTAACVHYRATGKKNFLNVAIKASDYLYTVFKDPSPELAALDWNPPHYMGLVEMYRTTGDKKYLELAETFINMLGTGKYDKPGRKGLDHSQKRIPFREETQAVGHAGHGNYMYCGVADVVAETGDKSLKLALDKIWQDMAYKKMYVTGGTGTSNRVVSHEGVVGEAYGKEYELPNMAYSETCANIGNVMWNWRMFLLNGDARYMDIMELALYNGSLSGIGLDGKNFFYTNPLRYVDGHPNNSHDHGERRPWIDCFCCPPNIVRTVAQVQDYAYNISKEGVWVNLYGSNVLDINLVDGTKVKLNQQTDYPWNGLVNITMDIKKKKEFAMMIRIPNWANEVTLKVNGKIVQDKIKTGSYFPIKRIWKKGDKVELNLPMSPQLIRANPYVENIQHQVAVKRGPLIYCLESVDLPKDVSISEVVIPQKIELKSHFNKDLLSGITVLEGEAEIVREEDWAGQLYKPLVAKKEEKLKIKLIPYYSWSNRGKTNMTVWMPFK